MTNTATAYDAVTIPTSLRVATLAALVGGAALVIDTVTITVINSSFGVLDSVVFFAGLAGLLVFAASLPVHLSARASGPARVGVAVLAFVAVVAALGALSYVADLAGRHVFSTANVGLHGEWSFFSVGVALLVIGGWARAASRSAG